MKSIDAIKNGFWLWLDRVAECSVALGASIAKSRTIRLVEEEPGQFAIVSSDQRVSAALRGATLRIADGAFIDRPPLIVETALRGSRVELMLQPDRFLFRPLDLPARAADFLEGVVRAQIDRLTPWSAELAAFGFSAPSDMGAGRFEVTVAATAKASLAPIAQAFAAEGARAISLETRPHEPSAPVIKIMNGNLAGALDIRKARRILSFVLLSCGLMAAATTIVSTIIDGSLESRQAELAGRIMALRGAALNAHGSAGDPVTAAERMLAKRKNQTLAAVIALEVLSRILPDRTYVTELRIEGDKLRLSGITDDAPRLIPLIEQAPQFTQATFFAPITRSSSDTRDRFDIEARIEPVFSPLP